MHISYWMLLVAALLPYATVALAKSGRGYDNADPRGFLADQSGWHARADYAHRNHFESLPFFAAAVLVAQMKGTPQPTIDLLAELFVAARVAYTGIYIAGYATLRSAVWVVGLACCIALFAA